jgi:IPT/TIG domain.
MAGTAIILRATVRKGGALVPDGTSVTFTTDFGFFLETGPSERLEGDPERFADVTLGATSAGLAKVKAAFECGTAESRSTTSRSRRTGPSSPASAHSGSCAGGDVVTINGGRFGTDAANVQVLFGGKPASVQALSETRIEVLTPARTLANPLVPEAVDVVVRFFSGDVPLGDVTAAKAFTYYCVDPNKRLTVTSVNPNSGKPEGGSRSSSRGRTSSRLRRAPSPRRASRSAARRPPSSPSRRRRSPCRHRATSSRTPPSPRRSTSRSPRTSASSRSRAASSRRRSPIAPTAAPGTCTGRRASSSRRSFPRTRRTRAARTAATSSSSEGGGFTAGGTSTTTDRTAVYFGGNQGVTLSVSDSEIRVTTPRRVLASPDKPETVDVRVIVDAGGPREACAQAVKAYTYFPGGFLEPVITSISPSAGPNDASTRVTIFGRNFKLPMQVFVGGVEASVVEIKASQIIFLTPLAAGPNSALAGQTVDVVVRDPYAGKEYTSPVPFRYYSCPTLNSVVPSSASWNQSTVVTIAGQSFEEPVEVTFESAGLLLRPQVTSVSSSLITFVMPVIDPQLGGGPSCNNVTGTLTIAFPALSSASCNTLSTPFTYRSTR